MTFVAKPCLHTESELRAPIADNEILGDAHLDDLLWRGPGTSRASREVHAPRNCRRRPGEAERDEVT